MKHGHTGLRLLLAVISFAMGAASLRAATPQHHYDFNGDTVHDLVGSVNGALVGAARLENNVLAMDGATGYVQFPENLVPLVPPFSVAFFAQDRGSSGAYMEFISQGYTMGPGFYIGYGPGRIIRIGDQILETQIPFPVDGGWHHYAVTAATNQTGLYIDGVLVGWFSAMVTAPGGSPTRLGCQFDPYQELFNGLMDELWVFDGVLSGSEVSNLAAQAHDANTQTLSWTGTTNEILALNTPNALGATSSSGLPVALTIKGPARIENGNIIATGLAAITVTAEQTGNAAYLPVTESHFFNIPKAMLRHLGGDPTITSGVVRKVQNFVYVANGSGLTILDITNPATPVRLSQTAIANATDLQVVGNYVYITSATAGLLIVDATNPSKPVVASTLTGRSYNLQISGNLAYFLDKDPRWADPNAFEPKGSVRVVNITDPAIPEQVAAVPVRFDVSGAEPLGLAVIGSYAYFLHGWLSDVDILDFSDLSHPRLHPHWGGLDTHLIGSLEAVGNYLYFTFFNSEKFVSALFDTSDPLNPHNTAFFPGDSIEQAQVLDNEAYVKTDKGLDLLDLTDPTAIQDSSKYVYASITGAGLEILELDFAFSQTLTWTEPATDYVPSNQRVALVASATSHLPVRFQVESGPAVIADGKITVTGPGTVWVTAEQGGDDTYLPASKAHAFNVRQAAVSLVGRYSDSPPILDFAMKGNLLFAGNGAFRAIREENGVGIFDMSDPTLPTLVGRYPGPGDSRKTSPAKISVLGNLAFVANYPASDPDTGEMLTSSFDILDVTDATKPFLRGSLSWWEYGDIPIAMQVAGQVVYVSLQLGPNLIIDVSNPDAPALLPVPAFDSDPVACFHKVGDALYVGANGLSVWDISAPTAPRKIAQYLEGSYVTAVHVSGSLVSVISQGALMTLQGDPTNLVVAGSAPVYIASGLEVSGDYIFVSNRREANCADCAPPMGGLEVFDVSNPARLVRVGGYRSAVPIAKVHVSGELAYIGGIGTPALAILKTTLREPPERRLEITISTSGQPTLLAPSIPGWQLEVSYSLEPGSWEWQDLTSWDTVESDGVQRIPLYDGANNSFFRLRKVGF